jgi:hypothetical protein
MLSMGPPMFFQRNRLALPAGVLPSRLLAAEKVYVAGGDIFPVVLRGDIFPVA